MPVGHVTALHRYPVKSLGGEALDRVHIATGGIPGDRAWAVHDETTGRIRSAKHLPALMTASARYLVEPTTADSTDAEITLPDGRRVNAGNAGAQRALSELVDRLVTLSPLQPSGSYFDAFPILVMSTNSLEHLQRIVPSQRFDVRRFRPNVLVNVASADPFPERFWLGRQIRIGTAVLDVKLACPRCSMTTHAFADLPWEPGIMRTLVRETDGNLGIYASVAQPGVVSVRDTVEVLA